MRLFHLGLAAALLPLSLAKPAESQPFPPPPPASAPGGMDWTYADLADLALPAPVAAHVEVIRARALRERDVTGVPPGHRRFLIEADVLSLIRGTGGIAPRITYLVDLPNDMRGRAARVPRRAQYLIFADAAPGRPGELRLSAPDAQIPWTPEAGERVRRLLVEANRADAAPRIVGIGRAFHVPGSLPGESESQIFLLTADQRPVSLTILRRPGERPRWAVALSEIVDAAAEPPAANSLLWYRLACTLPRALPEPAFRDLNAAERRAVEGDYRLVIEGLGPCVRSRVRR